MQPSAIKLLPPVVDVKSPPAIAVVLAICHNPVGRKNVVNANMFITLCSINVLNPKFTTFKITESVDPCWTQVETVHMGTGSEATIHLYTGEAEAWVVLPKKAAKQLCQARQETARPAEAYLLACSTTSHQSK